MEIKLPEKSPSILIILFGAIGDVTRGLSLVNKIYKNIPDCKITWAVENSSASILEKHPAIYKIIRFNKKKGLSSYLSFIKELRSHKYDVCLDLSRHLKGGITSLLSGAKTRAGFNRANSREGNWLFQTHHIEPVPHFSDKIKHFQKFGRLLGLPENQKIEFGLDPSITEINEFELKLKNISKNYSNKFFPPDKRILFLIASTWRSREWPSEHFAKLAEILYLEFGFCSYLTGGPSDTEKAQEILSFNKKDIPLISLCGETSLRELCILSKQSMAAIGSDSGPMHIASSVGLPVVSFWGSTSPERSTPFNNEKGILQSPIGCSPCYFRNCPGLNTVCLSNITPEIVSYKLKDTLTL